MNDLHELLQQNVAAPPPDHLDVVALVADGRVRVRNRRRRRAAAGVAAAIVTAVAVSAVGLPRGAHRADPAHQPPAPDAPTVHLAEAQRAVEGRDYDVLASYTNDNLDRDNGQYFDGVTDDGLILFRDGPRAEQLWPRFALMDPATGEKDWLPRLDVGQAQTWPVSLTKERLVLVGTKDDPVDGGTLVVHVFDRSAWRWSTMTWPTLADVGFPDVSIGPDGRLYVPVPATQGRVPEGGWPTGPDGEADDAGGEGDTYHLWSVSLADAGDVRDEGLTVGDVAFTSTSMVWTDSTNGAAGLVHVRDLTTGEEHSFDPQAGERCNLLSFGATDDRIVMGEYCGTYDDGVRDDRVQVLSTDGQQVVTIQDSSVEGVLAGTGGSNDLVVLTSYWPDADGTYVYDLGTDRLTRISEGTAKFASGSVAPAGLFLWTTPVNHRHGATQWVGAFSQ